jgi:hypothetical protein
MYICDAILGNRDRHHGNWGYLTIGSTYLIAPIYDNRYSLFPDVCRSINQFEVDEFKFLSDRSERFPASMFRVDDINKGTRKTNYYEIIGDRNISSLLNSRLDYFRNNLGIETIYKNIVLVVNDISDFIPEIYKRFYIEIVCMRYLHIIERLSIEDSYKEVRRLIND